MFETLLARIAATLEAAGPAYMVIGGQAVLLYGEPRLTRDIDVTLGAEPGKLSQILPLLPEMKLEPLVNPEPFVQDTLVLPCHEPDTDIQVDFIFSFSTYEQHALERTRSVELAGTPVRFASPEDVIVHKMVAGRPRDFEDVRSILLKNPSVDRAYVRRWLEDFTSALAQPLMEHFEQMLKEIQ